MPEPAKSTVCCPLTVCKTYVLAPFGASWPTWNFLVCHYSSLGNYLKVRPTPFCASSRCADPRVTGDFTSAAYNKTITSSVMTRELCAKTCTKAGVPYGFVVGGTKCYCYTTAQFRTLNVRMKTNSLCGTRCPGNTTTTVTCGGTNLGWVVRAPNGQFGF